jgi:hypothetical protein
MALHQINAEDDELKKRPSCCTERKLLGILFWAEDSITAKRSAGWLFVMCAHPIYQNVRQP